MDTDLVNLFTMALAVVEAESLMDLAVALLVALFLGLSLLYRNKKKRRAVMMATKRDSPLLPTPNRFSCTPSYATISSPASSKSSNDSRCRQRVAAQHPAWRTPVSSPSATGPSRYVSGSTRANTMDYAPQYASQPQFVHKPHKPNGRALHKQVLAAFDLGPEAGELLLNKFMEQGWNVDLHTVALVMHRFGKARLAVPLPVLRYCGDILKQHTEVFTARIVAMCCYGLQRTPDSEDLRGFVAVVATKAAGCLEQFDAQAVGNSLFGLHRCGSQSVEFLALVATLASKVAESSCVLSDQNANNALHGVLYIGTSPEARTLYAALADRIRHVKTMNRTDTISHLKKMDMSVPEICDLISLVHSKVL